MVKWIRTSRLSIKNSLSLQLRNQGKVVIVNLQKTVKDRFAHLSIHAPVDEVLRGVMALLDTPVPDFARQYRLHIAVRRLGKEERSSGDPAVKEEADASTAGDPQI